MRHYEITALVSSALLLLPSRLLAAGGPEDGDKTLPCRPTIACTAELAAPGTFEVEAGAIYRSLGPGTTQRTTPFLLKVTLATWAQLQVGSNGYTVAQGDMPAHFLDNIVITAKFHVLDQTKERPALAVSGAVSVPTWDGQDGYARMVDAFFTGYVSKDLGPVHGDLNVGLDLWRLGPRPLPQGFGALALSTDLPPPFGVVAEGYLFSNAAPAASRDGGFLFALTHSPRKWLTFDLGGDAGFFQATRRFSVFVGMTVIPVVLWR